ncbi:MAG: aminotransferase class I/II-fold pyridoxal phosphate-dependent enzyme [Oscillospiraceae bacterium]|jgi:DNA-binding transcriptional MocR family regulator|nr:aminotransferase class I/II-fold pyridoxal phosphate-dependent enzyme [Oscillospiraceae bacterium]
MYIDLSKEELGALKTVLEKEYETFKSKGLKLDMSRGKPCNEQLALSDSMLNMDLGDYKSESGFDCRNYGLPDGIDEAKRIFADMLDVGTDELILGGNASLSLIYDIVTWAKCFGVSEKDEPWNAQTKVLCPVPGYDRHFTILEKFGIEMLCIPLSRSGPDMNLVEKLTAEDENVKGIICVPMYSNPDGFTYSDETVRRLSAMKTAAEDFRIFWDNAYCVHHLCDTPDTLLNITSECKKAGNPDRAYVFASTSKITFAGGGICALASSAANINYIRKQISVQTICFDKLNQLRHVKFFGNFAGITEHMKKHRKIIEPKFNLVCGILERELAPHGLGDWNKPRGGYFISFNGLNNTAKRVVALCREAGVVLTGAGATFPYGKDPDDKNIRIAPTFPPENELKSAMEIFCASVRLASAEALLA